MDLRRRLASLDKLSRRPGGVEAGVPARDPAPALAVLGLTEREGPRGPVWIRDRRDPVPPPGDPLPDFTGFFSSPGPGNLTGADLLFVDTETTGLAGGTGTIPFLTGVSWWEDDELVTRQFFLPGPGREGPVLDALAELAGDRRVVVTFNGASFDLPLLRTRARLERRPDPFGDLVSWDLLVPARRLWGNGPDDCRQQTLEQRILGRARGAGDIDGQRIPQTWFDFLASGRPGDLPAVLRHNRRDMVGMAGLLARIVDARRLLVDDPRDRGDDWRLAWALGRICERRREDPLARRWMERALSLAGPDVRFSAADERFFRDTVRIVKRTGDWARVEGVLGAALASFPGRPWLHREAAILYEHRRVDLERARHHARRAGEARRLKRIELKISRLYGGGELPRRDERDD